MRKKIVTANWKMNKSFTEADDLINEISELLAEKKESEALVIIAPPAVYLELAGDVAATEGEFEVSGQNIYQAESGAFTGEVSAMMLKSMNVDYCIIGHSERRKYFNESNDILKQKIDIAINNSIIPIYCCGEILPEREAGKHFEVIQKQLEEAVFHLDHDAFSNIIIAYEPVWAIGTGVTATPEQAQEMHAFIRENIEKNQGKEVAAKTTILYGGSCNAKNASSLFSNPDVDGGLIGGASLVAEEFIKIVNSF